ncbi:Lrp/AsnC family transcriptional regulator [Methanocella sp. CWC-04]|uniref:Lrp/AsnC family transcriptional regulator n=1 Tax=Methanooceanicella nereidis TaxID=2052831 RepID=A0AAP2RCS8_9EURY|nr:Lrp/AsnC family transcriptional regulator [Methanocella sp. CWC-04]MCD1295171.1 Lrp/AsnC family transcriptional regulator [Methanocella sp. CWC-04]
MAERAIDEIDMKIISELSRDSNISHTELASLCGITRQTVASRIKNLEREGVIKNFRAVIDYTKIGFGAFFLLFLKLDVTDQKLTREFINKLKDDPNVLMDVSITGEWDVMLLLAFHDVREYETYINEMRIRMGPILKDTKSHVILNFYKSLDDYVPR